jgi:hypothetical protein
MRTDRQGGKNLTKLAVALRNTFAKAPKNGEFNHFKPLKRIY